MAMTNVMTDPLVVERGRALRARLLAVWPDFPELMREYVRQMRLLGLWQEDDAPLTHDVLDKIEEIVRALEAKPWKVPLVTDWRCDGGAA